MQRWGLEREGGGEGRRLGRADVIRAVNLGGARGRGRTGLTWCDNAKMGKKAWLHSIWPYENHILWTWSFSFHSSCTDSPVSCPLHHMNHRGYTRLEARHVAAVTAFIFHYDIMPFCEIPIFAPLIPQSCSYLPRKPVLSLYPSTLNSQLEISFKN